MFLLWINMHGSWVIGLGVIFIFLASGLVEFRWGGIEARRWSPSERIRLESVLLVSLAAIPFTPYGTRLAAYPFTVASSLPLNVGNILEWQPMPFNVLGGKLFLAVVLGFFLVQMMEAAEFAAPRSDSAVRRDHDGVSTRTFSGALRTVRLTGFRRSAGAVVAAI